MSESTLTTQRATIPHYLILYIVAFISFVADQVSKELVEQNLALYEVWAPIPSIESAFRFLHATNTGAAFGTFQNGSTVFTILAFVVTGFIILYNHIIKEPEPLLRLALGLQLGGALGNLLDRLQLGHVTDFIDVGPWPVFNIADCAIVVGMGILAFVILRQERRAKSAKNTAAKETTHE